MNPLHPNIPLPKTPITKTPLKDEIKRGQIIVAVSVLMCCAIGFVFNNYFLSKKSIHRAVESTAYILTQNLAAPLIFKDKKEIEKTIKSIATHPYLEGAVILDETHTAFASYPASLLNQPGSWKGSEYSYSIENQGDQAGTLVLILRSKLEFFDLIGYLLIACLVLVVGFFLAQIFSRFTTKKIVLQISNILSVIRTITQEEKYSTRIAKRDGGGEIQITELFELAEGFDSMLAVIESRENKITHINENLEKIVEQRTQQLQNAQANMMQSAKLSALGEMAAGVAHEINNPLAIICGTVSLSLERLESENPNLEKIREGLIKIENTSNKIAKIIRGLKMFSRNSEKDPMFPTPLASVINDTLELCQERFKEAGLALQVSPIPEMSIFCRPSQISQVILNLLNNAFDAIEGLSERWISLKVNALDSKIQIAVEDSGPGISPEILSKIMHPFFTTKAIGKGTGLGLSMSKGMIEDHAGTLEYDGSSGHTCFKIILPLRPNSALSATQDGVESPSKKIKLSF